MVVMVFVLMLMVLVMLVPMAMLARFLVMMMVFVYHSFVHFLRAKVRRPPCNRVAIFAGNG
jgi:uncharacterized membrane protein YqhA